MRSAFSACLFYGIVLEVVFCLLIANNFSFLLDHLPICCGYKCLYCLRPYIGKCSGQGIVGLSMSTSLQIVALMNAAIMGDLEHASVINVEPLLQR